ncbi:MAG TPA: DUF5335 family protein [Thermoanaerobaculia bacterium]|nr:DUF5335 family protein [Thermoanaerobaculia bacterium]
MATQTRTTREIKREEWPDFFDAFSRRHEGWLVTIELLDKEMGDQIEVENKALKGIVVERRRDPKVIDIFVWNKPNEDSSHIIDKPTRVRVEETEEGAEAAVEIQSEDHATTLLTFRSAALPETVDGVGPER